MKKRQYIHPQIEILALTDCNELLSGSVLSGGEDIEKDEGEDDDVNPDFNKRSTFSIFDDADDIYYLEEY